MALVGLVAMALVGLTALALGGLTALALGGLTTLALRGLAAIALVGLTALALGGLTALALGGLTSLALDGLLPALALGGLAALADFDPLVGLPSIDFRSDLSGEFSNEASSSKVISRATGFAIRTFFGIESALTMESPDLFCLGDGVRTEN